MKYFRFSFVPEEMVIPTIIFNSPYKANATIYKKGVYDGLKSLSAVTYFNYNKEIQVFVKKIQIWDKLLKISHRFRLQNTIGND